MVVGYKKIKKSEFLYFFFMVIQMAYMTTETRMFPGGLAHPIAWSIPFLWTVFILRNSKISFSFNRFYFLLSLCLIWSLLQIVINETYDLKSLGYYFSFLYTIVIAYVHINVFRCNLFYLYEYCMVIMCKIAIPLWLFSNLFPSISSSIAFLFPPTGYGRNILWVYNWMDPSQGQVEGLFTRNAGCSWEPGRFAVMLCLAIAVNLLYRGISWRNNANLKWLLVTLLTTFSTTGYVVTSILYAVCFFKSKSFSVYVLGLFFLVVMAVGVSYLPFLGEKLSNSVKVSSQLEMIEANEGWYDNNERYLRVDRIPSLFIEIKNLQENPYIGYGKDGRQSSFSKSHSQYYSTTGGLIQMFSVYGIFLGLFYFYMLYKSSIRIARELHSDRIYIIFICILLSLISYPLFEFAIFSAFWMYDFLSYKGGTIKTKK